MHSLLYLGLSNAAAAGLLALLVAAVTRWSRRPALGHALWLLVLLKLVTPPLWQVSLPEQPPAANPSSPVLTAAPEEIDNPTPETAPWSGGPRHPQSENSPAALPVAWEGLLLSAWLAGSVAWWLLAGWRLAQFQRLLRHARPAPAEVQDRAVRLAELLGLQHVPGV